jgi:hypothetical protein
MSVKPVTIERFAEKVARLRSDLGAVVAMLAEDATGDSGVEHSRLRATDLLDDAVDAIKSGDALRAANDVWEAIFLSEDVFETAARADPVCRFCRRKESEHSHAKKTVTLKPRVRLILECSTCPPARDASPR